MYKKYPKSLNLKSVSLRKVGCSLNEISKKLKISKSTASLWVRNVKISKKAQEKINDLEKIGRLKGNYSRRKKLKFSKWSSSYIKLISHLMFDGGVRYDGCAYYNQNIALINEVDSLIKKYFRFSTNLIKTANGVYRLTCYSKNLAEQLPVLEKNLFSYIISASRKQKIAFLRSFFDDEGSVYHRSSIRRIRGYQHNPAVLKIVAKLLSDFDINCKILLKNNEIVISKEVDIIIFARIINFSDGIFINPHRKNSRYSKAIEKRKLLLNMVRSYA